MIWPILYLVVYCGLTYLQHRFRRQARETLAEVQKLRKQIQVISDDVDRKVKLNNEVIDEFKAGQSVEIVYDEGEFKWQTVYSKPKTH